MNRPDAEPRPCLAASLALLLRYEHPERTPDERKTRSVSGIRSQKNSQRQLHAVGVGLDRLCECAVASDSKDGVYPGAVCCCFSAADLSATALYLSKNCLTAESIRPLAAFRALEALSLADNIIECVPEALRGMSRLKRLSLVGNPVMARPHSWEQILAFRPSLLELNGRRVDAQEKQRARDVYKEECVLANICHLLALLRTEEPGERWARALESVDQLLVGGVSLEQLSDEFFLFAETVSPRRDGVPFGASLNHELVVVANTSWVEGVAFSMSDNPGDECVESMLLEVTSSLVSLESLCREKEEGRQVAEVHALAMSIWRAIFDYRDAFLRRQEERERHVALNAVHAVETPEESAERSADQMAQERDALAQEVRAYQEQIILLRVQRDDMIKQNALATRQLEVLQQQWEESAVECDGLRKHLEDAMEEQDRSKRVMKMISEQLEACKRSEQSVSARNHALVDELDAANRDRAAAGKALRDADAALVQSQRAHAADLADQKRSFEDVVRVLRSELDALRNEPRVPVNIEIVNPDVTRQVSERDVLISQLRSEHEAIASQLASYQHEEWRNASAESYRREKARDRVAITSAYCFRSWLSHVRRRRVINRLEAVLDGVFSTGCREVAKCVIVAWRGQAARARLAIAFGEMRRANMSTDTTRLVLTRWHDYALKQGRVTAFVRQRSSNIARQALADLAQHAIHRRERLAFTEHQLAEIKVDRAKANVFDAWRRGTSLRIAKRAAAASHFLQSRAPRAACITRIAFQTWVSISRDAMKDRTNDLAAMRLHRRTLLSCAFCALARRMRHAQTQRERAERMSMGRLCAFMIESFRNWRALRVRRRALLASALFAWRSHARASLQSQKTGLQASLFLTTAVSSTRCASLQDQLNSATERAERKDALALKMAAACDALHGHVSETREAQRKALSNLAQKQDRLVKEKRSLCKQLNASLRENNQLLARSDLLQAANRQLELSLEAIEGRERRAESENKHLQLRLRASDAVKSSAQIRAMRDVRRTDDAQWTISVGGIVRVDCD